MLVSYIRLLGEPFNANDGAGLLTREHPYVQAAIDQISKRAGMVTGKLETEADVRDELNQRIDHWLARSKKLKAAGAQIGYKGKNDGRTLGLLETPGIGQWDLFTCLTSLRDVEPSVNLILNNYDIHSLAVNDDETSTDREEENA